MNENGLVQRIVNVVVLGCMVLIVCYAIANVLLLLAGV